MEYRTRESNNMSVGGPRISHLSEVAETMRDDALAYALKKVGPNKAGWPLEHLFDDIEFVDCFKYSLAKSLCDVLAVHDVEVREIHYYDPFVESDDQAACSLPVDATLHLLMRVTRSSAALERFITALDQALMESLKELSTPLFAGRSLIIDISLISDDDVRLGRGQASLLSSMYTPPLRIWMRES
jgi:hypothetical protein